MNVVITVGGVIVGIVLLAILVIWDEHERSKMFDTIIRDINGKLYVMRKISEEEFLKFKDSQNGVYVDDDIKTGFCIAENDPNWNTSYWKIVEEIDDGRQ